MAGGQLVAMAMSAKDKTAAGRTTTARIMAARTMAAQVMAPKIAYGSQGQFLGQAWLEDV